jgi:glucokinase
VIAGIDLGGTQVRVAVATSDGAIVGIAKARTAELGGPSGMVAWTRENAEKLAEGSPIEVVGIGVPGPSDPLSGVLVNPPNLPGWPAGLPLGEMLRNVFGAPVHLENDANVAAVAELKRGAGRGVRNLVYVTWSTGIGAGLILDGRLYSGTHGSAGELGHMVLDPNGPPCFCGMRGCVEAYASGHSIATRAGRPAADVFRAAQAGDPEAAGIVEQAARMVGLGLLNLANLVDPEVIVMGGGITQSWDLVEGWLGEPILASPFVTPNRRPRIVRAGLGADVGLVGAVEWAIENR